MKILFFTFLLFSSLLCVAQFGGCPSANAGLDKTICQGNSTTIGTIGFFGYTYSWFPTTGLSNPNIAQPTANPSQTTTYTLTVVSNQNLIQNGNFESGYTGFSSDYLQHPSALHTDGTGRYLIGSNPNSVQLKWCNTSNHTSGGSGMMIVDGTMNFAPVPNNYRFYYTTINVQQNTTYRFSGWAKCIFAGSNPLVGGYPFQPIIRVQVNGSAIGNDFVIPWNSCSSWVYFEKTWFSGNNTQATIEMLDERFDSDGNDFAIDDLSFSPCYSTDDVTVNVGYPSITPSGTVSICSNWESPSNPAILTSNFTYNLQWYRDGVAISGATSQTYYAYADNGQGKSVKTYTYTVKSNGCESAATTVNFVPEPHVFDLTNPCLNYTNLFEASDYGSGASYSWSVPGATIVPNSTSRQIQVTFPSSYTASTFDVYLTVYNSYGCNGTEHQQYTFTTNCGITQRERLNNEIAEGYKTIIAPNPANNQFIINSPAIVSKVEIYSATGSLIKRLTGNNKTITVSTSQWSPGVYFCKVFSDKKTETLKLLIKR